VDINLFLVTDFSSRDNGNIKIGNLANLVHKGNINLKCLIGFYVNSIFGKAHWFTIVNFNYFNCSIIWFDTKNVELKLKFYLDSWISFLI